MSKSKILCFTFVFILINMPILFAQFDEHIDVILKQENISFGQAVYIVLVASEQCDENAGVAGALEKLRSNGWKIRIKGENDAITLGEYSYLLMKAFNIPGGLMYMMFPGPRYAVRELEYKQLLVENPSQGRTLSGEEAMTLLARVVSWKEEE